MGRSAPTTALGVLLDAEEAEASRLAPAPRRAPPTTELGRLLDAEEYGTPEAPEPAVSGTGLNPLANVAATQQLGEAIRRTLREDGASDADAIERANDAMQAARAVGPGADQPTAVRAALAARVGEDTAAKAIHRAFGQRVTPIDTVAPTKADSDAEYRRVEEEYRTVPWTEAVAAAWRGKEAEPMPAEAAREAGIDKPWIEDAKAHAAGVVKGIALGPIGGVASVADTVAHFFGTDLPGVSVQEGLGAVQAYGEDKDVRALTSPKGLARAATGLYAASGAGEASAALNRAVGLDAAAEVTERYWDDVAARPEFDTASGDWYRTGNRDALDSLSWRQLPVRLRASVLPTERFVEAATSGVLAEDPAAEGIRKALASGRTAPAFLAAQVEALPLAAIRRVAPEAAPDDGALGEAVRARAAVAEWRGDQEKAAVGRLMAAGMLRPSMDGTQLVFVPSAFAEATRLASVLSEAVYEANIGVGRANPLYWAARALGMDQYAAMVRDVKLPNKAGLEFMAASDGWAAPLEAVGLVGGKDYAALRSPDSTFLSRWLTDVTLAEHQGAGFRDIYERAGGDPESGTAKALGTASILADFIIPAEEMVLGPAALGLTAAARARAARAAAREVGLSGKAAHRAELAAALPRLTGTDGIETGHAALRRELADAIESGRFNPDALDDSARERVVNIFREAGVEDPEAFTGELLGRLADRRAAILDTTADVAATGGPATETLRRSDGYRARSEALAVGGLSPQDRDLAMRLLEVAALRAADDGRVATPEEFIGSVSLDGRQLAGAARRLFHDRVVDADTARLLLGPDWEAGAAMFFEADDAGRLTERGREAFTAAASRALRTGSRDGVIGDVLDTVSDAWARVRNLPDAATPEFRAWWDAMLRPAERSRPLAIRLVDERGARNIHPPVFASGVPSEEIREAPVLRAGQRREARRVERGASEMQAALGLTRGQESVDAVELLTDTLAFMGTERMRRRWGFGRLVGLTDRVAVPQARADRVIREVGAHIRAAFGGDLPRPEVVDGAEVMRLSPAQSAGMARLLTEAHNSPLSSVLPDTFPVPFDDLQSVRAEDYNTLVALLTEIHAGAGAFRELRAERVAVGGAMRLWQLAIGAMERSNLAPMVNWFRDRFVASLLPSEYISPAARTVIETMQREIAQIGTELRREAHVIAAQMRGQGEQVRAVEILRRVADGMPPEVVPVEQLSRLAELSRLLGAEVTFDDIGAAARELHAFFTSSPVGAAEQMAREVEALAMVERASQAAPAGTLTERLVAAGLNEDELTDATAIVLEGLRRRNVAVEQAAADILIAFAGAPDDAILAGINDPSVRTALFHRVYAAWYSGDWTAILAETARKGHEAAGAAFDQGAAALTALLRLRARGVLSTFARRLAEAGLGGDVANLAREGLRFDRPYTIGSVPVSREAHLRDVAGYIASITGWADTPTITRAVADADGNVVQPAAFHDALGRFTEGGTENPAAYADALRILSQWGFKTGKGTSWAAMDLPGGTRVMVPDLLREPIEKVVNEAAPSGMAWHMGGVRLGDFGEAAQRAPTIDASALTRAINAVWRGVSGAFGYTLGQLRTGLTTGLLLPNPAFYVGNAMGGLFQLYQGVGAADALRISTRALLPTEDGAVIRRVLRRMWKDGETARGLSIHAGPEAGFFDVRGRWWSDHAVAEAAGRAGLNTSLPKAELASTIIADLVRMEPGVWNGIKRAYHGWQGTLIEAATAVDNYYRVATFVHELRAGRSVEDAARLAREVAFDYGALTDFEKKVCRKAVLFYSFMRRNQDLFWSTLLNNPGRVLAQLRALGGLQREALGDESELFVPEWADGRLVLRFRAPLVEGHAANASRGAMMLSPRLPVGDAVGLWLDLLSLLPPDPSQSSFRRLASLAAPWWQAPFVMATGVDVHTGREIEGYNTIPNWLLEMDRDLTGGMLVDDIFGARQHQLRDPAQAGYDWAPRWEATNARAWWLWRNLLQTPGAGRSMDTVTAMQRGDVGVPLVDDRGAVQALVDLSHKIAEMRGREPAGYEPDTETARLGLTEWEETAGWLGIKPRIVDSREIALGRLLRENKARVEGMKQSVESSAAHRYDY